MAGQHEIDGRQRPYPAENAAHRVNQLGTVLLDYSHRGLRPVHELLGEWLDKSEFYLTDHPNFYGLTALAGATADLASRWVTKDSNYGNIRGVDKFLEYAWLYEGLRVFRSGAAFLAPDDRLRRLDERSFRATFDNLSPWEAESWIERHRRNLELRRISSSASDRQEQLESRRLFSGVVPPSALQLEQLQQQQVRRDKGKVILATVFGPIAAAAAACAPVQEVPTRMPTFPAPSPEPTRTPRPFSLLEATPTLEPRPFSLPVNPPEYIPQTAGGAFPESIRGVAELDYYRALETLYRQEEGSFLTSNLAEYQQFLTTYARQNNLDVRQVWNGQFGDSYQLVSAILKRLSGGREAVYWFATPGGALSARPDIPSSTDSYFVPVELNDGLHADFRWNDQDRNVYLFGVDNGTNEAESWFNSTIADANTPEALRLAFESLSERSRVVDGNLVFELKESGELTELFPTSRVYQTERGDTVIINDETGITLAGQVIETQYGSFSLLMQDNRYQEYKRNQYHTSPGQVAGYPDLTNYPLIDEVSRIASTLVELHEREVGFGPQLANHQPEPKNFYFITLHPGTSYPLSQMLSPGLFRPEDVRELYAYHYGLPLLNAGNDNYFFLRFLPAGVPLFKTTPGYDVENFNASMGHVIGYFVANLVADVNKHLGMRYFDFPAPSYEKILSSPFGPLFSDPNIDYYFSQSHEGMGVDFPLSHQEILTVLEHHAFGVTDVVELDLRKFE